MRQICHSWNDSKQKDSTENSIHYMTMYIHIGIYIYIYSVSFDRFVTGRQRRTNEKTFAVEMRQHSQTGQSVNSWIENEKNHHCLLIEGSNISKVLWSLLVLFIKRNHLMFFWYLSQALGGHLFGDGPCGIWREPVNWLTRLEEDIYTWQHVYGWKRLLGMAFQWGSDRGKRRVSRRFFYF